MQCLH